MSTTDLHDRFADVLTIVQPATEQFAAAGFQLYLVGGVVRDLVLGGHATLDDIDLTTDARPAEIKRMLNGVSSTIWAQGERFGTIGAVVNGRDLEITTHRAESYDPTSRKPEVEFGDDLLTDLSRRDFSINAMAFSVVTGDLHDPFGGVGDLELRILRTPEDPEVSFIDDPLRMLRAARFIPRYGLKTDPSLESAVSSLGERLGIVSRERIHDELEKLLAIEDPTLGFDFLVRTGLVEFVVPGLMSASENVRMCAPANMEGSQAVRRAGLIQPLRRSGASAWLRDLRYSIADQKLTMSLLEGSDRLLRVDAINGDAAVSSELRDIVHRVGLDSMPEAFRLAGNLEPGHDDLEETRRRYDRLAEVENLADLGSPVTGGELIAELGMKPGPAVGAAVNRLGQHRRDHGPFERAEALVLVREWFPDSVSR